MHPITTILFVLLASVIKSVEPLSVGAGADNANSPLGSSASETVLALVQALAAGGSSDDSNSNLYAEDASLAEPYNVKTVVNAPAVAVNARGFLAPHIEALKLIETFLQIKQQALTRISTLVNDNYELVRAVFRLLSSKISVLTTFALKGIAILRRMLEFALQLFGQWTITLPTVSLGPYEEIAVSEQETHSAVSSSDSATF